MSTNASVYDAVHLQALQNNLLAAYVKRYGHARHQLETYNDWLQTDLRSCICDIANRNASWHVDATADEPARSLDLHFGNITIHPPCIREQDGSFREIAPHECRLRKVSYQVNICCDVRQTIKVGDNETVTHFREVPITALPCMVRSRVCRVRNLPPDTKNDEYAGYFIINGNEKTTQSQIKLRLNVPFVHRISDNSLYNEIRSCDESRWKTTCSLRVVLKHTALLVTMPPLADNMPLTTMVGLLDPTCTFERFQQMVRRWGGSLSASQWTASATIDAKGDDENECGLHDAPPTHVDFNAAAAHYTKERTPDRRISALQRILRQDTLPHLGTDDSSATKQKKIVYLSFMTAELLRTAAGVVADSDRDHWKHKRLDCAGSLISMLVRQLWRNFMRSVFSQIRKTFESNFGALNVLGLLMNRKVETGIKYHFTTGMWTVLRNSAGAHAASGVCQPLTRMNPTAFISGLGRINCPVNRQGKTSVPRMVHPVRTSDFFNIKLIKISMVI